MNIVPHVFISATSGDLRTARQAIKEALLTIKCHPVEQTNFGPDFRTLTLLDKSKIDACQALIHLVGFRYGAEPDPAHLSTEGERRSYTQMEYDHARALQNKLGDDHFHVYTFLCHEDFPFDKPVDSDGQPMPPEAVEKIEIQKRHRALIMAAPYRYELIKTVEDLTSRIHAIQELVLSLRQHQKMVSNEVQRNRLIGMRIALVMFIMMGVALFGIWLLNRTHHADLMSLKNDVVIDTPRIRAHLQEASERKLNEDLANAEKEKNSDTRETLREGARQAHTTRLERIDALAVSFAELNSLPGTTPVMHELIRILQEEGVDAALKYGEKQRQRLLDQIKHRTSSMHEENRTDLQPLLKISQLWENKGQVTNALIGYRQVLDLEPDWADAIQALHNLVDDARILGSERGTPSRDIPESGAILSVVTGITSNLPPGNLTQCVLCCALDYMGNVLTQSGDPHEAFQCFQQSVLVGEVLSRTNPESRQAARDLAVSLTELGIFLSDRGEPGDADAAFLQLTRGLSIKDALLKESPDSPQTKRDASVSHERLGDVLYSRGQPGDAVHALEHYLICMNQRQSLYSANPGSGRSRRDLAISFEKLGDFYTARGQTNDADVAFQYYYRESELVASNYDAAPTSEEAARDMAISLEKLGDSLVARSNPADGEVALRHYQQEYKIFANSYQANPDSPQAMRDLSISLEELGDFFRARGQAGDVEKAFDNYLSSLAMKERLHERDPTSIRATDNLISVNGKLGDLLSVRGVHEDIDAALKHYQESLKLANLLNEANPGSFREALTICIFYEKLIQLANRSGKGDARVWSQQAKAFLNTMKGAGWSLQGEGQKLFDQISPNL